MSFCQVLTTSNQEGAFQITNFITSETTPEEFEAYRKSEKFTKLYPRFQISFGGRCGWNVFCTSAYRGNAKLLEYLLQTYGNIFANVGNQFGRTPIFCATQCKNEAAAISCIRILIRFGGDPTITSNPGTSPLENCIALERGQILDFFKNHFQS